MNTDLSRALDILYVAEIARKDGCRRTCEILSLDPKLASLLVEMESNLGTFDPILLETVSKTIEDHNIERSITDWPFEHFWDNPYEPRHSKLLMYFIDPNAAHDCGPFLLRKLFEVLKNSFQPDAVIPVDHYQVSQPEYIDLLIERDCGDVKGKYAIIIENKVNSAKDQWKQLERYVKSVMRRGFRPEQIYVLYLPLTSAKEPNRDDKDAITKLDVNYRKITFETHITNWLESVLRKETEAEWPLAMQGGMLENISHYRNLIKYLVNKQKEVKMNAEILKQLEQAEKKNPLPTWSQVDSLLKSAVELKPCLESVLRGKLICEVRKVLKEQGEQVCLHLDEDPAKEINADSPYDEQFGNNVNLCIYAGDAVRVCFGCGPEGDGFWLGYMKASIPNRQKEIEEVLLLEAQAHLKDTTKTNHPWYFWDWKNDVTYDNCEAKVSSIAKKLVDMRKGLVDRLKKKSGA